MNVTISLPEELVRQARHRAVDRGMSLSKYVASVLDEAKQRGVTPARVYTASVAWQRSVAFYQRHGFRALVRRAPSVAPL